MKPSPVIVLKTLEDCWRRTLEDAKQRYNAARKRHKELIAEEGAQDVHLPRARAAELAAQAEYKRIQAAFTEFTFLDRMLREQPSMCVDEEAWANRNTLISVVDDDESVRDSTKTLLRSVGYTVASFESGERFLDSGMLVVTDCLVLDMRMQGMDGLELQRYLKDSVFQVPIIFISAHDDRNHRRLAIRAGAADYFQKPFIAGQLLAAVRAALKRASAGKWERDEYLC